MDKAEEPRLTEHQRYWLERIQGCEASGKSITAYAAEHGFPVRSMYDAKKVLVRKGVLPRTQGVQYPRQAAGFYRTGKLHRHTVR